MIASALKSYHKMIHTTHSPHIIFINRITPTLVKGHLGVLLFMTTWLYHVFICLWIDDCLPLITKGN